MTIDNSHGLDDYHTTDNDSLRQINKNRYSSSFCKGLGCLLFFICCVFGIYITYNDLSTSNVCPIDCQTVCYDVETGINTCVYKFEIICQYDYKSYDDKFMIENKKYGNFCNDYSKNIYYDYFPECKYFKHNDTILVVPKYHTFPQDISDDITLFWLLGFFVCSFIIFICIFSFIRLSIFKNNIDPTVVDV